MARGYSLLERVFFVLLWTVVVATIFLAVSSLVSARLVINGQIYHANDSLQLQFSVLNVSLANEINARIANDSYILSLLNVTNQSLTNYYTKSEVDVFLDGKLNTSDQRYNDSALILYVNGSLWSSLDYLNITLVGINGSLGQEVLSRIANDSRLENLTLFVNDTLWVRIDSVNASLQQEIIDRIANDSYLFGLIANISFADYYNMSEVDSFLSGKLNNSGVDTFYGNLTVSDTGFFSYIGSSVSRVAVGWFDVLFANSINATNVSAVRVSAVNLSGALNASDVVNAFWLPIVDQRYNDTVYIDLRLLQYYNRSEVDGFLDLKLNVSDQRYNDTLLILAVNSSLANYLLVTDQRYNDTALVYSLLSNYYNKSESDFLLDNKLNVSDQRYNDTLYILGLLADYYNKTEVDGLLSNYALNSSVLHNSGDQVLFGNFLVYGNFSVVGSVVNLTVENQLINGSIIPQISGVFDLGDLSHYWNNVYANFLYGQLNASYIVSPYWLNESDQRYNDTGLIYALLANYYNISEIDALLPYYNDSALIYALLANYYNMSQVDSLLDFKLNVSDQRYNDTLLILSVNASLQQEIIDRVANDSYLFGLIGNLSFNESDPVFSAENGSLWLAINSKLNISDQRYNDTLFVTTLLSYYYNMSEVDSFLSGKLNNSGVDTFYGNLTVSDTGFFSYVFSSVVNATYAYFVDLYADNVYANSLFGVLNASYIKNPYWLNESDQRYNDTLLVLSVNSSIKQPAGVYLFNDSQFFYVNESMLNITINNISKVRVITYNMTCTAVSGVCSVLSNNISYEITEVKVIPSTITNNYKFELTEYPNTANIIDKDRATHVGVWDIEKAYAIDGLVQANITNANIDENITVSIIYLTNGVQ